MKATTKTKGSINTVNMHEAKTHLSRLVDKAAKGESFIIAKAGKPMVKVTAFDAPSAKPIKRVGFMEGQGIIPEGNGFKDNFKEYIEDIFGLSE